MLESLKVNPAFTPRRGPVVLVIMDGVGIALVSYGLSVSLLCSE